MDKKLTAEEKKCVSDFIAACEENGASFINDAKEIQKKDGLSDEEFKYKLYHGYLRQIMAFKNNKTLSLCEYGQRYISRI